MTAVAPADAAMADVLPPLRAAIDRCALDLSGLVVFTEAASGAYIVTPVLAALAGARQVIALARPSRYGSVETVARATLELARLADVAQRIEIAVDKRADRVAAADIVTNSGHVRPIDAAMIAAMKSTAVIPLMYEAWEFRAGDVDLDACRRRGIAVAGTNERHPAIDVFALLGAMALRLLSDADIDVAGSRILLWCDNPFAPFLQRALIAAGARVDAIDRLDDDQRAPADAVLVAVQPRPHAVVGDAEAAVLARRHPGALVGQFWGDLDRAALARAGLRYWPLEAPPLGHQGILPSSVGPEPIVRLQSGGLKVGEVMARARAVTDGAGSRTAAITAAVASGFGQALPGDASA